ncbi:MULTISPECIES: pyridoxal 5'-phosphate synthase lyase subunit PdxS [Acidiplasma]|jgi:pyridoxal 5'-phosphate synthase pdxS subunit|uniref:Pyridoxal 5'-phosphate synthase subunit PdxS n=4 Tax=Acidiplasma TaxID=507753 RepID=A0A0Q0RJP7_9ARCH|nr:MULTISPECIES: pyridoxal 5'-phosphate synthase lyase subunit PdxS [Acidiplasma]KJE49764.1 pyridoxal biosynthesis lyase PdxS [Acidiplasma sp. MBA-1]KQB35648.1 pyridoxal biosynthesis lyase PdxS [Acidiplasma cupricumulans]KQB36244.1 pyridoxal biosynthesis lyase PdxS [Acidiplasma aeolicum]WMT55723.1 MAG: pyridoxal 5'-phosphate synthase lyase subunit PdxS [Acidiplasma sp.]
MVELSKLKFGDELLKRGFAKMTKGGVIMDVTTAEQAKIAEKSGAVAVMALERVPADIRKEGGVARMADPLKIKEIINAVSIPVMAKVRIGHITEAYVLENLGVDMLDESEVLTPADPFYHINKKLYKVPVVCGARTFPEAVRRIFEGAAMIRTKGEAGTGNIIEAMRHIRTVNDGIKILKDLTNDELYNVAESISKSYTSLREQTSMELFGDSKKLPLNDVYYGMDAKTIIDSIFKVLKDIKKMGRLPVVNFAAGGVATPSDAALMMKMGMDGVFVGSGIFKSRNPEKMAQAIVDATENFEDYKLISDVSSGLEGMAGLEIENIEKLQDRGW